MMTSLEEEEVQEHRSEGVEVALGHEPSLGMHHGRRVLVLRGMPWMPGAVELPSWP